MSRPLVDASTLRVDPAVKRFFEELEFLGGSARWVEKQAGLGIGTVNRWQKTNGARLDNLRAALNVLGWDIAVVPQKKKTNTHTPKKKESTDGSTQSRFIKT